MGNIQSNSNSNNARTVKKRKSARPQPAWNWDFSSGRPQMKPRAKAAPKRPLFKRQPSDDYNWWIGNPDPPKNRAAGRSSSSRRP